MVTTRFHIPKYNDSAFLTASGEALSFIKNNISMMTVPKEKLEFHSRNVNQIVHDGINCQACRRMNLKLSGDISAVSDYRVDRYKKRSAISLLVIP